MSKRRNYAGGEYVVDRVIELKRTTSKLTAVKTAVGTQVLQKDLSVLQSEIDALTNDGVISSNEKQGLKREWEALLSSILSTLEQLEKAGFQCTDPNADMYSSNMYYLKINYEKLLAIMNRVFADMDSDYSESDVKDITDYFTTIYNYITACLSEIAVLEDWIASHTIQVLSDGENTTEEQLTAYVYHNGVPETTAEFIKGENYLWKRIAEDGEEEWEKSGKSIIISASDLNGISPRQFSVKWTDPEDKTKSIYTVINVKYKTIVEYAWSNTLSTEVIKTLGDGSWSTTIPEQGIYLYLWQRTSDDNRASYTYWRITGEKGDQGEQGEGFSIYKTYSSVAEMEADADNVPTGSFVIIASDPEDEDNSKLYVKNSDGTFSFLTDLSGAQGFQGEKGENGVGVEGVINYYALSRNPDEVPSKGGESVGGTNLLTGTKTWENDDCAIGADITKGEWDDFTTLIANGVLVTIFEWKNLPVEEGVTYTISFWAKADSTQILGLRNSSGTTFYTTVLTTEWTRYSTTFQDLTSISCVITQATDTYIAGLMLSDEGKTDWEPSASESSETESVWSTDVPVMTSEMRFLWNYEEVRYTDGTVTETEPAIIGAYGEKGDSGEAGEAGEDGRSIESIVEYYSLSTSPNEVPEGRGDNLLEGTKTFTNENLVIASTVTTGTYDDFTTLERETSGVMFDWGNIEAESGLTYTLSFWVKTLSGFTSSDLGVSITGGTLKGSSGTTVGTIANFSDIPTSWTRHWIKYTATIAVSYRFSITNNGLAIAGLMLSDADKTEWEPGVAGEWTTQVPTMTSTLRYLWNFERINFSDGSYYLTDPVIIGIWAEKGETGDKGDKGDKGDSGVGIESMTTYYGLSSSEDTEPADWSTERLSPTRDLPYLWTYTETVYTDGNTTTTAPLIIYVYTSPTLSIVSSIPTYSLSSRGIIITDQEITFAIEKNGIVCDAEDVSWSINLPEDDNTYDFVPDGENCTMYLSARFTYSSFIVTVSVVNSTDGLTYEATLTIYGIKEAEATPKYFGVLPVGYDKSGEGVPVIKVEIDGTYSQPDLSNWDYPTTTDKGEPLVADDYALVWTRIERWGYMSQDENLLLDYDAPSLSKVQASYDRYIESAGDTYEAEFFELGDDSPEEGIQYGYRLYSKDSGNMHCPVWYNGGIVEPIVEGSTITIGCWARVATEDYTGDAVPVNFQIGAGTYLRQEESLEPDGNWYWVQSTFENISSIYIDSGGTGTRIYIGGLPVTDITVEFCGHRCTLGSTFEAKLSETDEVMPYRWDGSQWVLMTNSASNYSDAMMGMLQDALNASNTFTLGAYYGFIEQLVTKYLTVENLVTTSDEAGRIIKMSSEGLFCYDNEGNIIWGIKRTGEAVFYQAEVYGTFEHTSIKTINEASGVSLEATFEPDLWSKSSAYSSLKTTLQGESNSTYYPTITGPVSASIVYGTDTYNYFCINGIRTLYTYATNATITVNAGNTYQSLIIRNNFSIPVFVYYTTTLSGNYNYNFLAFYNFNKGVWIFNESSIYNYDTNGTKTSYCAVPPGYAVYQYCGSTAWLGSKTCTYSYKVYAGLGVPYLSWYDFGKLDDSTVSITTVGTQIIRGKAAGVTIPSGAKYFAVAYDNTSENPPTNIFIMGSSYSLTSPTYSLNGYPCYKISSSWTSLIFGFGVSNLADTTVYYSQNISIFFLHSLTSQKEIILQKTTSYDPLILDCTNSTSSPSDWDSNYLQIGSYFTSSYTKIAGDNLINFLIQNGIYGTVQFGKTDSGEDSTLNGSAITEVSLSSSTTANFALANGNKQTVSSLSSGTSDALWSSLSIKAKTYTAVAHLHTRSIIPQDNAAYDLGSNSYNGFDLDGNSVQGALRWWRNIYVSNLHVTSTSSTSLVTTSLAKVPSNVVSLLSEDENNSLANELVELQAYLDSTDYIITKIAEADTEEEREALREKYAEEIQKRKEARKRINEIEEELKNTFQLS